MNPSDTLLLNQYERGEISKEDLLSRFSVNLRSDPDFIRKEVQAAIQATDTEQLNRTILLLYLSPSPHPFIDLFNQLLITPHHWRHQEIAKFLQDCAPVPSTIPYIRKALESKFDYLDYTGSESSAIAKWFSWLLHSIGTQESIDLIKEFSRSEDEGIRNEMIYRLDKIKMSTTIEVFPTDAAALTFEKVIQTAERNINGFLKTMGMDPSVTLKININDKDGRYSKEIQPTGPFEWAQNEYAWIVVNNIPGGTDVWIYPIKDAAIDPDNPWWQLDILKSYNKKIENISAKLESAKNLGRRYSFRRSAGQSGMIALSYGLIAAAVAELTKGILYSDDGAWDFERFPAESPDFLTWYFRPEAALDPELGAWAQRCIERILQSLRPSSEG